MADSYGYTHEADIIYRAARPQQQSTWVPHKRDWRYETGVYRHEDSNDDPKSRSVWDWMDYDYQIGDNMSIRRGDTRLVATSSIAEFEDEVSSTAISATQGSDTTRRPRNSWPPKNVWMTMSKLEPVLEEGGKQSYETVSLTVRLRFSGHAAIKLQQILLKNKVNPVASLSKADSPRPDCLQQSGDSVNSTSCPVMNKKSAAHRTDQNLSTVTSLLFKCAWVDETRNFNMKAIRDKVGNTGTNTKDYGPRHHWYADAVAIDALFPPGVPISAKEMIAFYPHHIRWKGTILRLTNNDFRGEDIHAIQTFFRGPPTVHTTAKDMNNYQRDSVKSTTQDFKTTSYHGTPDLNLFTDDVDRGKYIDEKCDGYTVPTFDHLLRGLRHFPVGIDARGLTQCLIWYSNNRHKFKPSLQLNVLHTQSLIRALRQPLRPYGPQNLDRHALQEWREKGQFEEASVLQHTPATPSPETQYEQNERPQLHVDFDNHDAKLKYSLQLRHVFMFPFLAMHIILGEALKLGIDRAEARRAEREARAAQNKLQTQINEKVSETISSVEEQRGVPVEQDKPGSAANVQMKERPIDINLLKIYRIPKRTRSIGSEQDVPVLNTHIPTAPRAMLAPRTPTSSNSPHSPAYYASPYASPGADHRARGSCAASQTSTYPTSHSRSAVTHGRENDAPNPQHSSDG